MGLITDYDEGDEMERIYLGTPNKLQMLSAVRGYEPCQIPRRRWPIWVPYAVLLAVSFLVLGLIVVVVEKILG